MDDPQVVSRDEWLAARRQLLAREKEFTRQRDALNAERRRLPDDRGSTSSTTFEGRGTGRRSLLGLFEGRGQLLIYHFMFDPDWDEGCPTCSVLVDNIGDLSHLHACDTTLVLMSRAPLASIERFRHRMGWLVPWWPSLRQRLQLRLPRHPRSRLSALVEYNYRDLAALGPDVVRVGR